jgi:hypothetical protein
LCNRLPIFLLLLSNLTAVGALSACSLAPFVQPGPAPAPLPLELRYTANVKGEGDIRGTLGTAPVTAHYKWVGNGKVEVRPFGIPILYFSGDSTFIVEPLPEVAAQAMKDVQDGKVVIERDGVKGLLNPPGTIKPAFPPPLPLTSSLVERMCTGDSCSLPEPTWEEVACAR